MPEPSAEEVWRSKTDLEVVIASRQLGAYTEEGQAVILAELERRRSPEYRRDVEAADRRAEEEALAASHTTGALIRRRVWLLVFLLAVPTVGYWIAGAIHRELTSRVQAEFARESPTLAAQTRSRTIQQLCSPRVLVSAEACVTSDMMTVVRVAAVVAVVVGVGWIVVMTVAGRNARHERTTLLRWFKPGLRLTAVVIIGLVIVHAAILLAVIYAGGAVAVQSVFLQLLILIGVGAAIGVRTIAVNVFSVTKKMQTARLGREVSRADAPAAWQLVDTLAERLGALRPDHMIVGLDPNFFVTEADVVTPAGTLTGRTLNWSLSLSRILTVSEVSAILGHELAHFRGEDTQFSEQFYPIYRGAIASVALLSTGQRNQIRAASLLPAIAVFEYFLETFATAERGLARSRELAADAAGASVTNRDVMASALVKVHAWSAAWEEVTRQIVPAVAQGRPIANLSVAFASTAAKQNPTEALAGAAATRLTHPTDSHPSLNVRLAELDTSLAATDVVTPEVDPAASASALLAQAETWEQELSAAYQTIVARAIGAGAVVRPRTTMPTPESARAARLIRRCLHCGVKVLPTAEHRCPSCGQPML
jgi:Zn-dependent protease with chaperone function